MNHLTEIQRNEYLDDTLDDISRRQVKKHLSTCDQCRAELDELHTLFFSLSNLPDAPLTHDLVAGILAHLPKRNSLWKQPAFLMQSMLTVILLSVSIPILRSFDLQIAIWRNFFGFSIIQWPTLPDLIDQVAILFTWHPIFSFRMPEFSLSIPALPTLSVNADANFLLMLGISAGMLWIVGNISLLRNRPEVKK